MKKIVRLSETQLSKLIKKVINEQESSRYMFFSNLEQMKRQCDILLDMNEEEVSSILENGHDWAQDHIAEAKNNMDQVFDFLMNETERDNSEMEMSEDSNTQEDEALAISMTNPNLGLAMSVNETDEITEKTKKNKPTNPKLWQQCLFWARSRYKVCPSAYCNGAAAKRYKSKGGKWKKV
jgi:hypothetical protein